MKNLWHKLLDKPKLYYSLCALLGILLSIAWVYFFALESRANGDGSDEPDKPVRQKIARHSEAGTYARVLYRDDLINPTRYFMEIKVPPDRKFPTISSDNIQSETNIHALIRLRGVYAPRASQMKHRYRPHRKVERERHRYNETMTQVWKLLSSSEYLVLRNVQVDEEPPEYAESMTEYPGFVADIYYAVGEVERTWQKI